MKRQALLHGRVIHGDGQGRKIGYPTANLDDRYFKTNPQSRGVFASRAWLNGRRFNGVSVIGVPDSRKRSKFETHLLDVDLDLYGSTMTFELLKKIRPLIWFARQSTLLRQIGRDVSAVRAVIRQADIDQARQHAAVATAVRELEIGMRQLPSILKPGRTEVEVRDKLLAVFRRRKPSFPFIVAAGPSGAFMHHAPTRRRLRAGDSVVVDLGITVDGFCSDLTRTYFLGTPTARQRQRYLRVLQAQAGGIKKVRPFVPAKLIDNVVRSSLTAGELRDAFIHTTGHGLGRKIHEPPALGARSVDMLLPGQIVTVEPGAYFKDWGGIRIEDMVLLTNRSAEHLTRRIPRTLAEMIV